MILGIFTSREDPPTDKQVFDMLGSRRELWEKLDHFVADNYPISGAWNFVGKNWIFWYRKSGKTLLTLYPQQEGFVAQVVLGKDQAGQALELKLGKNVGTVLREAKQLHDGRWLFIKVKSAKDVKDIEQLLQVKRVPKAQTQG